MYVADKSNGGQRGGGQGQQPSPHYGMGLIGGMSPTQAATFGTHMLPPGGRGVRGPRMGLPGPDNQFSAHPGGNGGGGGGGDGGRSVTQMGELPASAPRPSGGSFSAAAGSDATRVPAPSGTSGSGGEGTRNSSQGEQQQHFEDIETVKRLTRGNN